MKVNVPGVKIDHRRGYYAPADYQHSTKEDKELQLQEQLASELPVTDLPLYMSTAYFRMDPKKYYVEVSLVVPGSEIPFIRASDRDKANLDDGAMWPTDFALKKLTAEVEARIAALVKQAVS